jgi:hypothetical protein
VSALVSATTLLGFLALGEDEAGADQAVALAGQVESLLLAQCRRTGRPFQAASAARTERRDGTGGASCWLDYPIAALTSVKLGYDSSAPIETLTVTDPAVLVWRVGSKRLTRVDGGIFGSFGAPLWIQAVYDTAADLPDDAALAVLRVTAAIWRQRGAEDVKSERVGGYSADLEKAAEGDPMWQMAVQQYRVMAL